MTLNHKNKSNCQYCNYTKQLNYLAFCQVQRFIMTSTRNFALNDSRQILMTAGKQTITKHHNTKPLQKTRQTKKIKKVIAHQLLSGIILLPSVSCLADTSKLTSLTVEN
ncbi:unnamed protein product [Meganyctiphanes norvegica]|uniref:Uncharacterized protein n=1 Tax=Meganyctiphanes norvegica TaxID=48144 RepID=A0AAV2R8L2_MEGNR